MMIDRPREVLGSYITVQSVSTPRGFVCKSSMSTQRILRLVPMVANIGFPLSGEHITCVSAAGRWDSVVVDTTDEHFDIEVPDWVSRSYLRSGIRVSISAVIRVDVDDQSVTGRLFDVSTQGLAVSVSNREPFSIGRTVTVQLPAGPVPAIVRTVRSDATSSNYIVGFELTDPSEEAKAWLLDAVERGRLL